MSQSEVLSMLKIVKHWEHTGVKLMVGTMTSYKVLNGIESKWTPIFPPPHTLKDIFAIKDKNIINCIHYADYEGHPDLAKTLKSVARLCGPNLNAIQLDMVWPNPKELISFQKEYSGIGLVLQINKAAMTKCNNSPFAVAKKVRDEYSSLISHVLLDCSMGNNIPINARHTEDYIQALKTHAADVEIAIAGGLCHRTLHTVAELITYYRVSLDAQSGLRISGKATDPIDWYLAEKYLHKAIGYYS